MHKCEHISISHGFSKEKTKITYSLYIWDVNELNYSNSTYKILEFDSKLVELNSNNLSSRVRVSQYPTELS